MKKRFKFSACRLGIIVVLAICLLCGCTNHETTNIESTPYVLTESSSADMLDDQVEKDVLEKEMLELALSYRKQYVKMDKGTASNVVISEERVRQIAEHIASCGYTVSGLYQDMINYEVFEEFLLQAMDSEDGSFQYVSNRIRPEDKNNVPSYTLRSEHLN